MDITINRPNFLGSEVGLVLKTIELPSTFATYVTEDSRKIVKAGTIVTTPYYGLVFQDIDITNGDAEAPLMIGGYYINANLPATAAAYVTEFAKTGLFPFVEGTVTRPDYGVNSVDLFQLGVKIATFEANETKSSVSIDYNTITISAPLDDLEVRTSADPEQGDAKWVGILIDTGMPSIIGVKYGTYDFTATDVAEATAVGGVAGEFVLWIKANIVVDTPKTFVLSKGTALAKVTVNVVNTSV